MRATHKVELSVHALFRLLHSENLGAPHAIFAGGERYYSPRFAAQADAALRGQLAAAGVLGRDRISEDFLDQLALVQRASVEYFGWLHDDEGPYTVLVAAAGRRGVLAQRAGDSVTFEPIDGERLVPSFVQRLPAVRPAAGEPFSIRSADYTPLSTTASESFRLTRPPAARSHEARRLDALTTARKVGGGKLYTARRDSQGVRSRSADWITLLDLEDQGRWAVYHRGGTGERSINVAPGTPALIADRLAELQRGLRR